ncbi:MAG: hypothetical protein ACJAU6_001638 [Alphaproteobacteria bacterium]|jgi:hypothetical protein
MQGAMARLRTVAAVKARIRASSAAASFAREMIARPNSDWVCLYSCTSESAKTRRNHQHLFCWAIQPGPAKYFQQRKRI